jgi:hypothetical protein
VTLYIGSVIGGTSTRNAPIVAAIDNLSKRARQISKTHPSELSLDVVFHVAGPILPVGFEGVRTGRFSKKERLLQLQIATPEDFSSPEAAEAFALSALRKGIDVAESYVAKKGLGLTLASMKAIVDEMS